MMTSSSAGIVRCQSIKDNHVIKADDRIIDIGCGGKYLLELIARSVGPQRDYLWVWSMRRTDYKGKIKVLRI